jgi:hypothetical protein
MQQVVQTARRAQARSLCNPARRQRLRAQAAGTTLERGADKALLCLETLRRNGRWSLLAPTALFDLGKK